MAYDEFLADRVRNALIKEPQAIEEKKMFGGLCFMVNDKMCVGITNEALMLRIDPEEEDSLMKLKGVREMNFTGRKMKGFLYVDPLGVENDEELDFFISKALEYNPKAKSSKKTKKK